MGLRLQDLPAYIMLGAVLVFFVYVIIQSRKPDNEDNSKEIGKK